MANGWANPPQETEFTIPTKAGLDERLPKANQPSRKSGDRPRQPRQDVFPKPESWILYCDDEPQDIYIGLRRNPLREHYDKLNLGAATESELRWPSFFHHLGLKQASLAVKEWTSQIFGAKE